MDDVAQDLWTLIGTLNLKAGDRLQLTQIAEQFLNETEYHPDDVIDAFEELAAKGWLEETDDGAAVLTQAGFDAR